jgi:uncharacterized MAPEG superfamily protein
MRTELLVLAWACVLALLHIFAAVRVKTRQYGTKWNMGARDETLPPPQPIVWRLARAQANFLETFPIAAVDILLLAATGRWDRSTEIGALLWLGMRVLYLPVYAAGIAKLRTVIFLLSVAGLALLLRPLLLP